MRALEALGQKVFGIVCKPSVRALFAEDFGNLHHNIVINNFLAAMLAIKHGNGNAPFSLAGNAPIGALPNH